MDTENTNDEQTSSISKGILPAKLRMKERSRSQTTPTNTDINDPENLDYEDVDDNHQVKQINNQITKIKTSADNQDEEGEVSNNLQEVNDSSLSITNNPATASDEGELDEADLEDGEIHDPSTSKTKNLSSDEQSSEQNRPNNGVPSSSQAKVHCRFFLQGRCHWGPNCKYIHPNNDSTKNSGSTSIDGLSSGNNDVPQSTSTGIPIPQATTNSWISPQATAVTPQFFPNPHLRGQVPTSGISLLPPTGTESAWERGLRSAKTLREQSMRRKQQDKDFNDKKFNLTIRDALDERETDDNLLNIDRPSPIDYDSSGLPGSNYPDQRGYSDRYHPYMYSNSSANHHRINNNSRHNNILPANDRRTRHSDDYVDSRNDNRNRKEKSSIKDNKSTSKRDDASSYKRNSSQQQYASGSHNLNNEQLHLNPYNNRRGDDWHDPWDRSRNHGSSSNRRSSGGGGGGGGREPSYSSSASSSSSSRSRSHSTSSSSRSRSRSRSRPKRRSPSVTRATKPLPTTKSSETVKNGNEKKSNGNKKLVSPSTTTNKFLPGRQISSHTLKKAEKSSNNNPSTVNNHSKDQRGKDSDTNPKQKTKNRTDSTSSSSSSDSDNNRITHRSSSSSSDSSSSENETRTKPKTTSKPSANPSSHSTKSISRQSSTSGNKNPKPQESSSKKRRDTSSSTGSTSTTKKTKLNTDSHDAENSDSSKKKEKQKILKKLQEVEKLISQRSTKTSS